MTSELYQKNIQLLAAKHPDIAAQIDAVADDASIVMHTDNPDAITASYVKASGDMILLHSKYNPVREAVRLVDGYQIKITSNIAILGFGLGYHVLELIRRPSRRDLVMICEKNTAIVKNAFRYCDFTDLLQADDIVWSLGYDPASALSLIREKSLSALANGFTVLLHPPSVQVEERYYEGMKASIAEFLTYAKVNINTQMERAEDFVGNAFENLDEFLRAQPVSELFGIAKGRAVFVVGAGPSLDKTVHLLRHVQDRAFIIVVDSAVATLLEHGITPDFVISIDFTRHTMRYFKEIDTRDLNLVFDAEIYPEVVKAFKGRKYAIHLPYKSVPEWIRGIIGDKGAIAKGLSVSHAAVLLAAKMQAEQIILVGQDLAYPRSQWHAKGSSFFQTLDITSRESLNLCMTTDIFGKPVETATSMMVFKNHFELLFSEQDLVCYDATEGGARIAGTEVISLKDAIIRFCPERKKPPLIHGDIYQYYDRDAARMRQAAVRIKDTVHTFNAAIKDTLALIEQTESDLRETGKRDRLVDALVRIRTLSASFENDQEILGLLKDSATEALLIRAIREEKIDVALQGFTTEEILARLTRERMFFFVLSKAGIFVEKQLAVYLEKQRNCVMQG